MFTVMINNEGSFCDKCPFFKPPGGGFSRCVLFDQALDQAVEVPTEERRVHLYHGMRCQQCHQMESLQKTTDQGGKDDNSN